MDVVKKIKDIVYQKKQGFSRLFNYVIGINRKGVCVLAKKQAAVAVLLGRLVPVVWFRGVIR